MIAELYPELDRVRQENKKAVLETLSAHLEQFGTGPGDLLFTADTGEAIRRPHAGHIWRKAARRIGLERRSFHDLRHHCASVLIDAGFSVKVVQHHLGHASAKQTLDTYSHLWPDDEDRTRAALDVAMRPVVDGVVSDPCHDHRADKA